MTYLEDYHFLYKHIWQLLVHLAIITSHICYKSVHCRLQVTCHWLLLLCVFLTVF